MMNFEDNLNVHNGHADQLAESTVTYESKLESNLEWAISEGSRHFEEKSAVRATLQRLRWGLGLRWGHGASVGSALFFVFQRMLNTAG